MSNNTLSQAIALIRSDEKRSARQLLMNHLAENPQDDRAWLILSAAVDSPLKRRQCIEMALSINPQNERAHEQLQRLGAIQGAALEVIPVAEFITPQVPETRTPAFPTRAAASSSSVTRRKLVGIGAFVLVLFCLGCYGIVALSGFLDANSLDRTAEEQVATRAEIAPSRSIPATNTPRRTIAGVATLSTGRCPGAGEYLEAIDDEMADFAELANLSFDSTSADELALYSRTLSSLYDDFMENRAPECGFAGARQIQRGMEAIMTATSALAEGSITNEQATEDLYDGARQMLRGYNVLLVLSGEPPLEEPGANSETERSAPHSVASTPFASPMPHITATPELLPAGSALLIEDGIRSWEVTVTNIEYRSEVNLEVGGDLIQQYIAEHRYVVLFLDAVNTGRQTDFFFPHPLAVRDALGQSYEHDQIATQVAEDFVYDLETLSNQAHPGGTARAIAVFDLPVGAGPFSLHDDWLRLTGEIQPGVLLDIQD